MNFYSEAVLFWTVYHCVCVCVYGYFRTGGDKCWIGLKRQNRTSRFQWTDNSRRDDFLVIKESPKLCGRLKGSTSKTEQWGLRDCENEYCFICQIGELPTSISYSESNLYRVQFRTNQREATASCISFSSVLDIFELQMLCV